jgi:DNA-binding GntR family transcriptional regulator
MGLYKSKKDIVVEAIRDAILSGDLEPGARILQEDIAERLQVSPTPVREAIRQLEAEGALQYSPNRGVRVSEVNSAAVKEIYLMRAELEDLATRLAVPRLSQQDILRIQALQAQIRASIASGDLRALRRPNYDLHMVIYQAAGMPELFRAIRSLWSKCPLDILQELPYRAQMTADEHEQFIQAIKRKEAEVAGKLMRSHINRVADALADYLHSIRSGEATKSAIVRRIRDQDGDHE